MQKSVLGIDIGNFNIKIVETINNNGKMEILNYAIGKTPENSINDGKITDFEKIKETVKALLAGNFIKTKQVIGLVSSSALVTREVNVPKMKESDITKYILLDSQQYFPMDVENYVLDFKIINEIEGAEGSEYTILLAAIPDLIINDYVKLFDALKLDLVAIDIVPNVLSKYCINYLSGGANNTIALIDLGDETSTVNIVSNGVLEFSRMIPSGSGGITQNLANTFGFGLKEAEDYKIKNAEIVIDTDTTQNLSNNISEIIKPILDSTVSQINKYFEFFYSRNTSNKINNIYISGGGSLLKGLDKYFQIMFNIPTRKVDLLDGVVDKSHKPTAQVDLPMIINAFASTYREQ